MTAIKKYFLLIICLSAMAWQSCRKDFSYVEPAPPAPPAAHSTDTLEAVFASTPPNTVTAAFWNKVNWLAVDVSAVSTGALYGNDSLNMTGLFGGLSGFHGKTPGLTIKAAYDSTNLYILAEWQDTVANFSYGSFLFNGPIDPHKSASGDTAGGWTNQRNCDHFSMAFEISPSSGSLFTTQGCAASCHGSGDAAQMSYSGGTLDVWNWSTAHSAPLGYAEDMVITSAGLADDAGNPMWYSNGSPGGQPLYEWNGTTQNVTLPNGGTAVLDPAYFLLKSSDTPYVGNPRIGDSIFHTNLDPPVTTEACADCHGNFGEGGQYGGVNSVSLLGQSRASLNTAMANEVEMAAYYPRLDSASLVNVIAYIRGLQGIPGTLLATPSGSNADLTAVSNVTPFVVANSYSNAPSHSKYQVLIIRKLKTGNSDDVQFNLTANRTFTFGVALMDNDGKNHIGSMKEILTFK